MRYTEFKRLKNLECKCDESYLELFKEKNTIKVKDKRNKTNEHGAYDVHVIGISEKQIYVACPYCNDVHNHGRTESSDGSYGTREPHCRTKNKKAYFIYR